MKGNVLWMLVAILGLTMPVQAEELTPLEYSLSSAGFERIAKAQGVTVYKDNDSDNIRIAAEGRIAAPPEVVLKALLAYEKQTGIIKRVTSSKVIERGPGWVLVYQHLNLPIISDRDFTLKVKWGADGDNLWVTYQAVTDRGPKKNEDIVRVSFHEGSWQLVPIMGGAVTQVRFQVSIDLAGSLPKFLARSGAGDEIPDLFASVRSLIYLEGREGLLCLSKSC